MMLNVDVAILMSTGNLDKVKSHLSYDVKWIIVNDRELNGYEEVLDYFEPVKAYFDSVEVNFRVNDVIASQEKVVVVGIAEFYNDNQLKTVIEACDVYTFKENKVSELKSFCITLDKNLA